MTNERRDFLDSIKSIDKNIASTEQLLESLLPNINRMMEAKWDKQIMENSKNKKAEIALPEFW